MSSHQTFADPSRATLPVEGMTCASCVNRIERHLRKLDGVDEAHVNLATETATVRYDAEQVSLGDLGQAVENAGYEARLDRPEGSTPAGTGSMPSRDPGPRTMTFEVTGMTCVSCVNRIERHVRRLPGVQRADVNLATERTTVVADPGLTGEEVAKAIEAAGYEARAVADDGTLHAAVGGSRRHTGPDRGRGPYAGHADQRST